MKRSSNPLLLAAPVYALLSFLRPSPRPPEPDRYPIYRCIVVKTALHKVIVGVLLFLIYVAAEAHGQFVDLRAQIEFYQWWTGPARIVNVHCVVGTNSWEMDGGFSYYDQSYYFTGKRIIESINPHAPASDPQTQASIANEFDCVYESVDGNPGTLSACSPDGQRLHVGPDYLCTLGRIAWLGFCSGPCLKRPGRLIFPPSDLWKELVCAPSGFSDRTEVFDDALGLPKRVDLFTPRTEPVLQYRVTNSTNFLGWHFPLEFNVAQYRPAPLPESPRVTFGTNGWELEFTARVKVTSIGVGTKPRIPAKFVTAGEEQ